MSGFSSSNYNYMDAHRASWESDERTREKEDEEKRHETGLREFEKAAGEDFTKESTTLKSRISQLDWEMSELEKKKNGLLGQKRLYEMLLAQMKKQNLENASKQKNKRKLDEEK